jgi:hypothetical protein
MKTAKSIILPGVYTALLIGVQFVLSGVAGVELVTILLLCFCYRYGIKQGMLVANAFSLLRCFIFGFFPNVIILYLIYYNVFALVGGWLGTKQKGNYSVKKHAVVLAVALLLTLSFTLLDNIITPLMSSSTWQQAKVYAIGSITILIPQLICTAVTTIVLFRPLTKFMQ